MKLAVTIILDKSNSIKLYQGLK